MSSTDLLALSQMLDVGMDLPASQRSDWLAQVPESVRHLVPLLAHLLQQHEQRSETGAWLAPLPLQLAGMAAHDTLKPGDTVAAYRLLREIGRGGMGTVWLAERADGAFSRRVALKIPRLLANADLALRMAQERQISALLEHPNIARLYDAGVDAQGRPYMAMQYIDGLAIDAWCVKQDAPFDVRLRLLMQVANAVAFAHGHRVVHRDIKPSNVLVGADGQVHLLDFGVAQFVHDAAPGGAEEPAPARMLTPRYAAPEQMEGGPVSARTDVWGLGVLGYVLLAGRAPQMPEPQAAAAAGDGGSKAAPQAASTLVPDLQLARRLRGNIDALLRKALQPDPALRYASAQHFADDIARHLARQPVLARTPSALYTASQAIRRHSVVASSALVVVLALLGGTAAALFQAHQATAALQRESVIRTFVTEFLRSGATSADHAELDAGHGRTTTALQSVSLVDQRFASQPGLRAELHAALGSLHAEMAAWRTAAAHYEHQLAALADSPGGQAQRGPALLQLATVNLAARRFEAAEQRALQALPLLQGQPPAELDALVLRARALLARGRSPAASQATAELERAVARVSPTTGLPVVWMKALKALELRALNRSDQALPLLDEAAAEAEQLEGPLSLTAVELRLAAARMLAATTFADKAAARFNGAVRVLAQRGGGHAVRAGLEEAAFAAYRYAAYKQLPAEQALHTVRQHSAALRLSGRRLPPELDAQLDLLQANVLATWGDFEGALRLYDRSAPLLYESPSAVDRLAAAGDYAFALTFAGRHTEADLWVQRRIQARADSGQAQHPYAVFDHIVRVENLKHQGLHDDALAVLDALPTFEAIRGEGPVHADRYNLTVKLTRSAVLLDRGNARAALQILPRQLLTPPGQPPGPDDWNVLLTLGQAQCQAGQPAAGLAALKQAMALYDQREPHPAHPERGQMRGLAGLCALALGQRVQAQALATEAARIFAAQPGVSAYFKVPWARLSAQLRSPTSRPRVREVAAPR